MLFHDADRPLMSRGDVEAASDLRVRKSNSVLPLADYLREPNRMPNRMLLGVMSRVTSVPDSGGALAGAGLLAAGSPS